MIRIGQRVLLAAFVVVTATFTFMANPPKWQKATLMMSSIPIAVACNLVRLCFTAVLYMVASTELAEVFFHDLAGWLMMPLAILAMVSTEHGKITIPAVKTDPEEIDAARSSSLRTSSASSASC